MERRDLLAADIASIQEHLAGFENYDFVQDVTRRMEALGLSQNSLAARVKVSHTMIGKWLNKGARPRGRERYKELAMALGMDHAEADDFLRKNSHQGIYLKNPLDAVYRFALATSEGGADTVGNYKKLVKRYMPEGYALKVGPEQISTEKLDEEFRNVGSFEELQAWMRKNDMHFLAYDKSYIPHSELADFAFLYVGTQSINELFITRELPIAIKNLLYPLIAEKEVPLSSLRSKLIVFGLYESMTADEIDRMLDVAKLLPLTKPSARIDRAVMLALRCIHRRYPYFELNNAKRAIRELRGKGFAELRRFYEEKMRRAQQAVAVYEKNRPAGEEYPFERYYTDYADKNILHYLDDVFELLIEGGALRNAEVDEYRELMQTYWETPRILLVVKEGSLSGKTFAYTGKETLIVGRNEECAIALPDVTVSRYHCLVDISPDSVMVRDFGSLNGTYLNGVKIGQRGAGRSDKGRLRNRGEEFAIKSGDRLGLGKDCVLELRILRYCAECLRIMEESGHINPEGRFICSECHRIIIEEGSGDSVSGFVGRLVGEGEGIHGEPLAAYEATDILSVQPGEGRSGKRAKKRSRAARTHKGERTAKARHCEVCGRAFSGSGRLVDVCGECYSTPAHMLRFLMGRAGKGEGDVGKLAGYREIGMIREDGAGATWLLENEKSGDRAELKILLPHDVIDESVRRKFLRELFMTGLLEHPNLVRRLAHGGVGDVFFVLAEHGGYSGVDSLMEEKGGRLSVELATGIILQTLSGLVYGHTLSVEARREGGGIVSITNGMMHGDVNPGNIRLFGDRKIVAKIADFGLARGFEGLGLSGHRLTGRLARTPMFMPRQQIMNARYSRKDADVWATAASYYYMLTGVFPKDLPRGKDMVAAALSNEPVPIRERRSGIPRKLAEVIDQALIEKPEIGVHGAVEFKRMIESAL